MTNTGRTQFRYILRNDFFNFMVSCFYELHPHATFLPNLHLEIIADKLAACQRGEIKRLIINLPPRQLKSGVIAYDTANNEKIMRVHAQTAKFEEGLMFLPHQAHWLQDFIRELTGFPNGKFDDQVDATIQAIEYFSNRKAKWFDV